MHLLVYWKNTFDDIQEEFLCSFLRLTSLVIVVGRFIDIQITYMWRIKYPIPNTAANTRSHFNMIRRNTLMLLLLH